MVIININNILKREGKSKYWLEKQTGISSANLSNIIDGITEEMSYKTLEKLCYYLNCEPNDIFKIVFDDKFKEENIIL